jgi:phage shock protein E
LIIEQKRRSHFLDTKHLNRRSPAANLLLAIVAVIVAMNLVSCSAGESQQSAALAAQADSAVSAQQQPINVKIAPQQYQQQFTAEAPHQLIDVRTAEEFASGHIPGALNIPVQELEQRLGEVASDQPVVLYCRSGNRSAQAAQILGDAGYGQIYDLGGIAAWQQAGLPIE